MTTNEIPPIDDRFLDLHDALEDAGIVDLVNPEDPARNDEWVSGMLRSIRAMDATIREIDARRETHIQQARIEAEQWRKRTYDALVHEASNRRAVLESWALANRLLTGRASFDFPAGKVKTTKTDRWVWTEDDAALVAYLHTAGRDDLVRVKESPDKSTLRKVAQIKDHSVILDGEALPADLVVVQTDVVTASVVV